MSQAWTETAAGVRTACRSVTLTRFKRRTPPSARRGLLYAVTANSPQCHRGRWLIHLCSSLRASSGRTWRTAPSGTCAPASSAAIVRGSGFGALQVVTAPAMAQTRASAGRIGSIATFAITCSIILCEPFFRSDELSVCVQFSVRMTEFRRRQRKILRSKRSV